MKNGNFRWFAGNIKTEIANFRLFAANGNGKFKFFFLGLKTINGKRRLLFQQTCPSMINVMHPTLSPNIANTSLK